MLLTESNLQPAADVGQIHNFTQQINLLHNYI